MYTQYMHTHIHAYTYMHNCIGNRKTSVYQNNEKSPENWRKYLYAVVCPIKATTQSIKYQLNNKEAEREH